MIWIGKRRRENINYVSNSRNVEGMCSILMMVFVIIFKFVFFCLVEFENLYLFNIKYLCYNYIEIVVEVGCVGMGFG